VSLWTDVGSGHRVQVLDGGIVLWEHDCPPGYTNGTYLVRRHTVDPKDGETWTVVQAGPLTLSPSLHCDPALGGCGAHGHVQNGRWA
jgi:hypothetical protein